MKLTGFKLTAAVILFLIFSGISSTVHGHSNNDLTIIAAAKANTTPQQSGITYLTKDGFIAATSESLLNRIVALALSGNQEAFRDFLKANPDVFPLKGGIKVLIEQTSWPGKVKIRPCNTNIQIWTLQEAIK